jgi:hypothetical protein
MERVIATLIGFERGVITCEAYGKIEYYIQRDVHRLTDREKSQAITLGMLPSNYKSFEEFPRNYSLNIEDPEIQGKVTVTFSKATLSRKNGTYSRI